MQLLRYPTSEILPRVKAMTFLREPPCARWQIASPTAVVRRGLLRAASWTFERQPFGSSEMPSARAPKPILLVEDNPQDLDLALRALARTSLDNEIIVARDGEEAWQYLAREGKFAGRPEGNPAVVLLDLKLPKLDGTEVLERIRKTPGLEQLPVVMLTASREDQDIARSYELNVNAYVVKPIGFTEFLDAIRDLGVFWAALNEPPPPAR